MSVWRCCATGYGTGTSVRCDAAAVRWIGTRWLVSGMKVDGYCDKCFSGITLSGRPEFSHDEALVWEILES